MRCKMLTLVLAWTLLYAAGVSAREHVLLAMPGMHGKSPLIGYQGWAEVADLQYQIEGLPPLTELFAGNGPEAITHEMELEDCEILLRKQFEDVSPELMQTIASGKRIGRIKLALLKVVDANIVGVMTYELKDVLVSEYGVLAPGFGDRDGFHPVPRSRPMELLKLMPKSISWQWRPPKPRPGE